MYAFYTCTGVAEIGTTPLPWTFTVPEKIAANFYNANAAVRTITLTMVNAEAITFVIQPGTSKTVLIDIVGDLSVSASAVGVYGWVARK